MSTKTTIKRIALVAVSALGMGLLSVIPANAVAIGAGDTDSAVLAVHASATDATLSVSNGTLASGAATVQVRTSLDYVELDDLALTVTGASSATATDNYSVSVSDASNSAGTINNYSAKNVATGVTGNTSEAWAATTLDGLGISQVSEATSGGVTLVGAGGPDTIASGKTYYVHITGLEINLAAARPQFSAANDVLLTLIVTKALPVAVTFDTTTTTIAGRVGQQVSITPTAKATTLAAVAYRHPVLRIAANMTAQPSVAAGGSLVYPTLKAVTSLDSDLAYASAVNVFDFTGESTSTGTVADSTSPTTINYSTAAAAAGKEITGATGDAVGTITFTPKVAGVHTIVVWNESAMSGTPALSGAESYQTFTINVTSSAPTSVALTGWGTTSSTSGTASGSLVKVSLKDAAGNIAIPATGETVTLTPSGSGQIKKVNDNAVTSAVGASYNLAASDFGQTGTAWVNVVDAVAETISLTATISGSSSAAISLTYKTATNTATNAPAPYNSTATGYTHSGTSTGTTTIPLGAITTTYRSAGTYNATTTVYHMYSVEDTSGNITGVVGLDWDAVAGVADTGYSSYSVTTTSTVAAQQYTITSNVGTTTTSSAAVTSLTLTPTVNTINATSGGSTTITGVLTDTFGRAAGSTAVTAVVTGRNPSTVAQTAITDALGNFSFTIADANTTSLLTSDTVTLDSAAYTTTDKVVTILYGTANAASKVVLTSDDYTAGVANDSVSAQPIVAATSTTGKAGAEAGAKSVSAKVTNAAGAILAGVPVTFTVSGTGAAILSTKKLVYTDLTGVATTSVYAWKSGTYTVTATAGAVSGTATETFSQSTAAAARIISATANGSVVTAKAEDRFGNPVANVRIYAKIASGSGYFGTGVTTTYADTTIDGTASFVVSGGAATVTVSNISFSSPAGTIVGQTSAAKGYDIGGADAVAFVATVAGTSTVAETGVGNEYAAAGVSSATVDATVSGSSDAIDAANEATDAANAATDAANAAAEAADAATAAAQDAQAAVAELATKVASLIAGIKAQITTLTNLVIKIQKKVRA